MFRNCVRFVGVALFAFAGVGRAAGDPATKDQTPRAVGGERDDTVLAGKGDSTSPRYVTLAEMPKSPIVVSRQLKNPSEGAIVPPACPRDLFPQTAFRTTPEIILRLERPLPGLKVKIGGSKEAFFYILEPGEELDSNGAPNRCPADKPVKFDEVGDYKIHLFFRGKQIFVSEPRKPIAYGPQQFSIVIAGPKSSAVVAVSAPSGLPVAERLAKTFLPTVEIDGIGKRDSLTEKLFMNAPKEIFVFPKFDLDAPGTAWISLPYMGRKLSGFPKGARLDAPRKDEPLLLFRPSANGVAAITADGLIVETKSSYLSGTPSGRPNVPRTARNGKLEIDRALLFAVPGDARERAPYDRARNRYDKCADGLYASVKYSRLRLRDDYVEKRCNYAALERVGKEVAAALAKKRTARRNASLERIRRRLVGESPR